MEVVVSSLKRGLKVKNAAYTNNVLLILIRHLEKGGEATASTLAAAGTIGLLEQLFEIFQGSDSICMNAFIILNLMTSLSSNTSVSSSNPVPITKRFLCHSESFKGILSAITVHYFNMSVVSQGIQLILFLSSNDDLLRKMLLHQNEHIQKSTKVSNGITSVCVSDVLVKVMRNNSNNNSLMESVCRTIYNLTYDDEEGDGVCRSYLAKLGMCKLLVDLLYNSGKASDANNTDRDVESIISNVASIMSKERSKQQSGLVALPYQYQATFPTSNRLKIEANSLKISNTDADTNHNDYIPEKNIDINGQISTIDSNEQASNDDEGNYTEF
jgi:hypothetical protein